MSKYLAKVSDALIEVLDRAVHRDDHRIIGFGANAEFWGNEVDHCLRVIRGFPARQEFFDKALKAKIGRLRESGDRDPTHLFDGEADDTFELGKQRENVAKLETAVVNPATAFFRRLWKRRAISYEQWHELQSRFEFLR